MKGLVGTLIALAILGIVNTHITKSRVCEPVDFSSEITCLTNQSRKSSGLSELSYSLSAEHVAKSRAEYICSTGIMKHDGWESFLPDDFITAGENLARNYDTANDTVNALLLSPKHKENIMGSYETIGVYTLECGNNTYTVQIFLGR